MTVELQVYAAFLGFPRSNLKIYQKKINKTLNRTYFLKVPQRNHKEESIKVSNMKLFQKTSLAQYTFLKVPQKTFQFQYKEYKSINFQTTMKFHGALLDISQTNM